MEQDIRASFSKAMLPVALHSLVDLFSRKFKPVNQGTLVADAVAFVSEAVYDDPRNLDSDDDVLEQDNRTRLPPTSRAGLSQWLRKQSTGIRDIAVPNLVLQEKSFVHRGASYKPKSHSTRDSYIVVGTSGCWRPAQIQSIFTFKYYPDTREQTQTLFTVRYFAELNQADARFDNYRKFPAAAGRICYSHELPGEEVISATDILCHVARTPGVCSQITKPHLHVLPLDRVRLLPHFPLVSL